MTHFYELWKRIPRERRRELATFIHRLKCLCGRKYHLRVLTNLDSITHLDGIDCVRYDNVCVCGVEKLDAAAFINLQKGIIELMDKFGIPRRNFFYENEECYVEGENFIIDLYTDK